MTSGMVVEIPFNAWSKEKLDLKKKRCTSRNKIYGMQYATFQVGERWYILKLILRLPLWFVRDFLYPLEGADTPEEFVGVWKNIHRGKFNETENVYVHFFEEIEDPKTS